MELILNSISFNQVENLLSTDILLKNDSTNYIIFGDEKEVFKEASFLNDYYFISLDYIYIHQFNIRVHCCSSEYSNEYYCEHGYAILDDKYNDYYIEMNSYLDSALKNYANYKDLNYFNISEIMCDIVFNINS